MPNRLSYLELLMWFIILFQCVAVLLQTAKISKAIAHKKPYGLNGISFWAFVFWTFFIIPGIVWEIFRKKSSKHGLYNPYRYRTRIRFKSCDDPYVSLSSFTRLFIFQGV